VSETHILYAKADGQSMQQNLADIELAKSMSAVLQRHYPGHSWAVNVDGAQGVATIKNFRLSGNWGFLLHLKQFSASEYEKRVVMAAGELLERYALSRGRFRQQELESVAVDGLGNAEFAR
jgi:hypothetical protein